MEQDGFINARPCEIVGRQISTHQKQAQSQQRRPESRAEPAKMAAAPKCGRDAEQNNAQKYGHIDLQYAHWAHDTVCGWASRRERQYDLNS